MMSDLASFYESLQKALKKVIERDFVRPNDNKGEVFFAHRFAHYLENELRQTLLFESCLVDLCNKKRGETNLVYPNIEVSDAKYQDNLPIALYVKLNGLTIREKKTMLELYHLPQTYAEIMGICLKPDKPYVLWYFVYDDQIRFKKITKKKLSQF